MFFQKRLQDYNTSHQKQVKGAENRKRLDAAYSFCPLRNPAKRMLCVLAALTAARGALRRASAPESAARYA